MSEENWVSHKQILYQADQNLLTKTLSYLNLKVQKKLFAAEKINLGDTLIFREEYGLFSYL